MTILRDSHTPERRKFISRALPSYPTMPAQVEEGDVLWNRVCRWAYFLCGLVLVGAILGKAGGWL